MVHLGTANGGHYKVFVKECVSGHWLGCNDSSVPQLSLKEVDSLFLQTIPEKVTAGEKSSVTSQSESYEDVDDNVVSSISSSTWSEKTAHGRDDVLRENTYMLM